LKEFIGTQQNIPANMAESSCLLCIEARLGPGWPAEQNRSGSGLPQLVFFNHATADGGNQEIGKRRLINRIYRVHKGLGAGQGQYGGIGPFGGGSDQPPVPP